MTENATTQSDIMQNDNAQVETDTGLYHPVQIGSLVVDGNIFLAPVAGYSNAPFRSVCAKMGADFAYTELVSSEALIRASRKTNELLRKGRAEKKYAIQLFGGVPEHMAEACRIVLNEYHCACIDINAGCPMPKITKSGGGSILMKNPAALYQVVKAVADVCMQQCIPVTVKMRSGWDSEHLNWKTCTQVCIDAGAKAVTLHPRTSAQRYSGKANWDFIAETVALFGKEIPIFASGDLFSPEDAARCLKTTGCAAIMFARGALGNPFIFQQTKQLLLTGTYQHEIDIQEKLALVFDELYEAAEHLGETRACLEMRKKFAAATKGVQNGAAVRAKLVQCSSIHEYRAVLENILSR